MEPGPCCPGPPGPPSGRELILRAIGDEVHRLVEVLATNVHHQLTSKPKTGWWFGMPLWKIWLRQLGWWHSQYMEKYKSCSKPPTRRPSPRPRNMINMACWARQSSDVVRLKKLTSKSRSSRSSGSLYCLQGIHSFCVGVLRRFAAVQEASAWSPRTCVASLAFLWMPWSSSWGLNKPLWKIWKSIGMMKFPIYRKIKNLPNHQPVIHMDTLSRVWECFFDSTARIWWFAHGRVQKTLC